MRKLLLSTFLILGLLIVAGKTVALAQIEGVIRADIPFSFYVGNKQFPAGRYEIRRLDSQTNVLEIINREKKLSAVFLTENVLMQVGASHGELIFDRYGDKEFLSKILDQGDKVEAELMKSRAEKRMEKARVAAVANRVPFYRKA
jgi:hypothetical protein